MKQQSSEFIMANFPSQLQTNRAKAEQKKQQYLQRIMQIFREFVRKSEGEITRIIDRKILKMEHNYQKVQQFLERERGTSNQEKGLILSEFLTKPFEKFPFSGNKNQKAFRQQYNLIEKAALLIEQTLIDSFNEDEIPSFENHKFFETVQNNGIGQQSLARLSILPQNLSLQSLEDLLPLQKNVRSIKVMGQHLLLVGDESFIEIWNLQYRTCVKKLFMEIIAPISCLSVINIGDLQCLGVGFGEGNPEIWIYRSDNWRGYGSSLSHTRSVTKLVQADDLLISGSLDGSVCLHSLSPFTQLQSCPHISSVQDLIFKNNLVYVLLKCSSLCEYELQQGPLGAVLQFRRTLSTGFISMIRYTQVGSNFTGVACHIYGLSQIQITRKFKVEETYSVSESQMIADFVVLEAKHPSEYFAICCFQNSSSVRIYSLKSGQAIYEIGPDYQGQPGVAGYLPKMQICWMEDSYWVMVVCQAEFDAGNTVRIYKLGL